jgi:N-acetylmuramoyl-L-alanine amidase
MSQPSRSPLPDARPRAAGLILRSAALSAAALALVLTAAGSAIAAPLVFIDPGHGGPYSNANRYGLKEKHINLWLALELRRQLQLEGFDVGMTRTRDRAVGLADIPTWQWSNALGWGYYADWRTRYKDGVPRDDLQARVDMANAAGADVFISIHNNGSRNRRANGTEVWASPRDALGVQLSRQVQTAVVQQTRLRNRGAFKIDFYVVRWANMPSILVEGAFITNRADARRLSSPTFRRAIARGIVVGLKRWLATDPFQARLPRYGGDAAADVAVAASAAGWPSGSGTVLLASSADPSYALAAAPYASALGAPLLYADASGVPAATAAELARLRPTRLVTLGDTAQLPVSVVASAAAAAGVAPGEVRRVAGLDRYSQTALLASEPSVAPSNHLVVVSDASPADVLSASTCAAAMGGHLLLVPAGGPMPPAIASFLATRSAGIARTLVVGDASSVSDAVFAALPNAARVAMPDVYRTNTEMMLIARPTGPVRGFVVSPANTAEGIVASVAAAHAEGGAIVLNSGTVMAPSTRVWITSVRARAAGWTIVGNTGSQPYLVDWMVDKAAQ